MGNAGFFRHWRGSFFRRQESCGRAHQCRKIGILLTASLSLTGCTDGSAPAFSVLGSYFPSWIACAVIGIITAVLARVLFIRMGIDEVLPWRLFVYVCLALAVAFLSSLLIFTY